MATALVICQASPAQAQDDPGIRPDLRPGAAGANSSAPTPLPPPAGRSPQAGAMGANESARPAAVPLAKPTVTPGGPVARTQKKGAKVPARPGPDLVTLNFVNAEIEGVVKVVGEITGRNFILR